LVKKRRNRSGDTSRSMAFEIQSHPRLLDGSAVGMSVANICTVGRCGLSSRNSSNAMAREYVSCPVEQPADQMRMVSGFFCISAGNTSRWSASNTAGSREETRHSDEQVSYKTHADSGRFFSDTRVLGGFEALQREVFPALMQKKPETIRNLVGGLFDRTGDVFPWP